MTKRTTHDVFNARSTLSTPSGNFTYYRLGKLQEDGVGHVDKLPFSMRVMLENLLRNIDHYFIKPEDVERIAAWNAADPGQQEMPFLPARVVLQDFTGVPAVVDLAALRSAMARQGGDPAVINPSIPVDLVIDHSVQVDYFASSDALRLNADIEFKRNRERYEFLKWGKNAFSNFRVVPPATGIVHQVNLEYLAKGVFIGEDALGEKVAYPDTIIGTDSHTTMINGLGVVGWGVGGIEAEAVMLGQPLFMVTPEVIGFKLYGSLREGVTATDLTLVVVQMLRKKGVVDKFVEFYGTGLTNMSLPDRATIANMAPEYGATMGFFPIDAETISYLRRTGRSEAEVELVEWYAKAQGIFRTDDTPDPVFTDMLELDLSTVEPSMAGPKRPQDRVSLGEIKSDFNKSLTAPVGPKGYGMSEEKLGTTISYQDGDQTVELKHGSVVIAAITSCTNTSNPSVMLAAGMLARNAVERGLNVQPYVKTSMAPGSKVVTEYLTQAGLIPALEALGFHTVGYGCTTCIGNSGPLPEAVSQALNKAKENKQEVVVAAVLSGNRNFEGRVHPQVQANFLASPPLVVAYALAGTVDIDLLNEPIGHDKEGNPVFLNELWPTQREIIEEIQRSISPEMFHKHYGQVFDGNPTWNAVPETESQVYHWDDSSTYVQEPPFFLDVTVDLPPTEPIQGARVLALFRDSITTDHISPAGSIAKGSPAGQYLIEKGVELADFNSYGARRGNDRIMTRGTFANTRIKNYLLPRNADGAVEEGSYTIHLPSGDKLSIYEAAMRYKAENTPLIVLGGVDYGMGSSRDWAAKGTLLLGVRAVIVKSFERIHRSNLVFMGVLPLQFKADEGAEELGLTGHEVFTIDLPEALTPMQDITVRYTRPDGSEGSFETMIRLDTNIEIDYYRNGGILNTVLRNLLKESPQTA